MTQIPDDDSISCTQFGGEKILEQGVPGNMRCSFFGLFVYFFTMSAVLWWVMLMVAWCLSTGFQWSPEGILEMSRELLR